MIEIVTAALQAAAQAMTEKAVREIGDRLGKKTKKETKFFHHKLFYEPAITEESIKAHVAEMRHWCENIYHHGMPRSAGLDSVFVSMRLNSDPKRHRMGNAAGRKLFRASEKIDSKSNLVLTGDLGAGKTTLLKRYALKAWSKESQKNLVIFRFRDFRSGDSVFSKMCSLIKIDFGKAEVDRVGDKGFQFEAFATIKRRALAEFCNKFGLIILLDGLDEAPMEDKTLLQKEVIDLSMLLSEARIIVTSRPTDITRSFTKFETCEIEPLDEKSMIELSDKWFNRGQNQERKTDWRRDFMADLSQVPYADMANRPLMLVNLCIIYEKYKSLPSRAVSAYHKMVSLCVEEWDAQRGVKRSSKYSQLDSYNKERFLSSFAFNLLKRSPGKMTFDRVLCEEIYREIGEEFKLPASEYREVAEEIESTTGIISKSTYDEYEFSHKSIFEYLVASYLVKSGVGGFDFDLLGYCPNEAAIAVSLSSSADIWMRNLFFHNGAVVVRDKGWSTVFLHRIVLEKPNFRSTDSLAFSLLVASRTLTASASDDFYAIINEPIARKALIRYFANLELEYVGNTVTASVFHDSKEEVHRLQFVRADFTEQFGGFL